MKRHISKVLIDDEILKQLIGTTSLTPRLFEAWAIEEIEGSLWLRHSVNSRLNHFSILPSARSQAIELSQRICQHFANHDCTRRMLSIDGNGQFVESETKLVPSKPLQGQRGQRKIKTEIGPSPNIKLSQSLMLSIWNPAGEMKIEQVGNFLARALEYLKCKCEKLEADATYDGVALAEPFSNWYLSIGWLGIWFPDERLSAVTFVELREIISNAFSVVSTIENFKAELPLFIKRNDSPRLTPVLDALENGDDISAFQLLLTKNRI